MKCNCIVTGGSGDEQALTVLCFGCLFGYDLRADTTQDTQCAANQNTTQALVAQIRLPLLYTWSLETTSTTSRLSASNQRGIHKNRCVSNRRPERIEKGRPCLCFTIGFLVPCGLNMSLNKSVQGCIILLSALR